MSIVARVWMPSNANSTPSCTGCGKTIAVGEIYVAEDWQLSNSSPIMNCMGCGFAYILAEIIDSPTTKNQLVKSALAELCKIPVREELHKIIREECADPNGPISPGTGTSSP
jgi:hypothetical protein